jgi:hypothetical protein
MEKSEPLGAGSQRKLDGVIGAAVAPAAAQKAKGVMSFHSCQ